MLPSSPDVEAVVFLWAMGVVGALAWLVVRDARWFMEWNADMAARAARGDYAELEPHHQKLLKSWRPTVLLLRRVLMPGQLEAQRALHLHMAGDNAAALQQTQAVMGVVAGKGKMEATVMAVQVMALTGLCRVQEAEVLAQKLLSMPDAPGGLLVAAAHVSLVSGRHQECIDRTRAAHARDPADEAAHLLASIALMSLGRPKEALQETEYDVRPGTALHNPRDVAALEANEEGRQLLEAQERERAQVTRPSPLLQAANVYLDQEDGASALVYLERAHVVLGNNPGVVANFHFMKATALALRGDAAGADAALLAAEQAAARIPLHQSLRVDLQVAHARVALALGRLDGGLQKLDALRDVPMTPLGTHHRNYWRARLLQAKGDPGATAAWQAVANGAVEDVHTQRARKVLGTHAA